VEATPADHPLRMEFTRPQRVSVRLEVTVLLAGLAGLYFMVREPAR
jgi:hypothetical protein